MSTSPNVASIRIGNIRTGKSDLPRVSIHWTFHHPWDGIALGTWSSQVVDTWIPSGSSNNAKKLAISWINIHLDSSYKSTSIMMVFIQYAFWNVWIKFNPNSTHKAKNNQLILFVLGTACVKSSTWKLTGCWVILTYRRKCFPQILTQLVFLLIAVVKKTWIWTHGAGQSLERSKFRDF